MGSIRRNLEIAAPQDRGWASVVDYEARPRWSPRVKEARVLDEGPLREGSRIRLRIGRDRFTATVVDVRSPDRLSLLVKGPGFRVTHAYELEPSGDHTKVMITADYRGIVGRLVTRFMGGSIRRDLTDELSAIKAAAEAGLSE